MLCMHSPILANSSLSAAVCWVVVTVSMCTGPCRLPQSSWVRQTLGSLWPSSWFPKKLLCEGWQGCRAWQWHSLIRAPVIPACYLCFLITKRLHCLVSIIQLDPLAKSLLKHFVSSPVVVPLFWWGDDMYLLTVCGYFSVACSGPFGGQRFCLMESWLPATSSLTGAWFPV